MDKARDGAGRLVEQANSQALLLEAGQHVLGVLDQQHGYRVLVRNS